MRRALLALIGAAVLVAGLAVPAAAETDTVKGRYDGGPIVKLWAKNGEHKIIGKVYGDGGRNKIHMVSFTMRRDDGKEYEASAFWYFDHWYRKIAWEDNEPKSCDGLEISWNGDGDYWKFAVARSCVPKLPNKIKAKAEMSSQISNVPGVTPFTEWLSRG